MQYAMYHVLRLYAQQSHAQLLLLLLHITAGHGMSALVPHFMHTSCRKPFRIART